MKSKRSASKRFRVNGSGRIKRAHGGKSHLMRGKNKTRLRALRKRAMVSAADEHSIHEILPYGA